MIRFLTVQRSILEPELLPDDCGRSTDWSNKVLHRKAGEKDEQLHLERAYRKFFGESKTGFPKFKSKHGSRKSYTTNVVNGNIRISEGKLRLPKVGTVKIRLHREIPAGWTLKSVTVSMDPSGKYYASLLFAFESCENKASWKKVFIWI